jgi:MFS family permease
VDSGSRRLLLAALASGTLLNPLSSSMLAVALTRIQHDFGLSFASASWLISSFYVASAVGHPVTGRLTDVLGARRTFLAGLALVGAASVAAPLAPSFELVVVARVLQALGTSALYPAAMRIVSTFDEGRDRSIAVIRVCSSAAAALGPAIGGLLLTVGDWWTVFAVNIPMIALSAVLAGALLPEDAGSGATARSNLGRLGELDWWGAALFSAGLVAALAFLLSLTDGAPRWWVLAASVLALWGMGRRERTAEQPFLHLRWAWRNRVLASSWTQFALVNVVYYAVMFGMPSYLQNGRGISASTTGVIMLSLAACALVGTTLAVGAIARRGVWLPLMVAGGMLFAGIALLLVAGSGANVAVLAVALGLVGFSNGIHNMGLQAALLDAAPPETIGAVAGLFMSSRYIGAILASAVLGLVFASAIDAEHMRVLLGVLAALAGAIIVSTAALRSAAVSTGALQPGRAPR